MSILKYSLRRVSESEFCFLKNFRNERKFPEKYSSQMKERLVSVMKHNLYVTKLISVNVL